ncbi:MAG TPA: hypothetical protein VNA14_11720 [Mycobacteriales bacterium]|nr:hypothetical protein [Mycobacteriales bacterium]
MTVVAALLAPQAAVAAPPSPLRCAPMLEGAVTSGDAGDQAGTGVVAVGAAQIVCNYDPATPPTEYAGGWSGHITMWIQDSAGNTFPGCSTGAIAIQAVGPVLVLRAEKTCAIPVTDRRRSIYLRVDWATIQGSTYLCCGTRRIPIYPVGVTVF